MTATKTRGSFLPISLALVFALIPLSFSAVAQEEDDQRRESESREIEEIVVTGFRGSLMQSLNDKRFARDIVDTINATDIGKFPDSNIAESLQRVTGVSIDRDGGEGRFITIRGLGPSFNLTTFNGRAVASDTPSRSFSYDTLAPEIIRSVQVYKTQNASLTEGGIGGLVNIRTAQPFDFKGRRLVGSVRTQYNDSSEEWNPRLAFLFSDRFNDDQSGLLLSWNYHKGEERIGSVNNFQWVPASQDTTDAGVVSDATELKRFPGPVWWAGPVRPTQLQLTDTFRPQSLNRKMDLEERERSTFNAVFQHAVSEDLTITVDALYSEFDVLREGVSAGNWFWNPVTNWDAEREDPALRQAYFDAIPGWVGWVPYETAEDHEQFHAYPSVPMHFVDANGTLTTMAHGSNGLASETFRNVRDTDMTVVGLNFDWQLGERLGFVGDLFYSQADDDDTGRNRIVTLETASATDWVAYDNTDGSVVPKILNFTSEDVIPEDFQIAQVQQAGQDISAENIGLKLDFTYELGGDFASALQFGAHFASNQKENTVYEENPIFQDVYKLNTQGFNAARAQLGLPNSEDFQRITLGSTTDDLSQLVTPGSLGLGLGVDDSTLFINDVDAYLAHITSESTIRAIEAANNPDVMAQFLSNIGYGGMDLWQAFNAAGGFNPQMTGDSYKIDEDTTALYANLQFEAEIGSMPLSGMLGLRYVETDIASTGTIRVLEDGVFTFPIPDPGGGDGTPGTGVPVFAAGGEIQAVKFDNKYDNLLPNLNLNLNITDDLIGRFAWSQAMTRPELEDIAPWLDYGSNFAGVSGLEDLNGNGLVDEEELAGVNGTASGSNPTLKPYVSTNIDLSLEWYYSDDSALTVAYFDKDVEDWITDEVQTELVPLASYPGGLAFFIDRPRNIDSADVDGVEFNWQHSLESGFGWQANLSFIDSNAVLGLDSNFSLVGLSDTRNLIVFYERGGFQTRLAYNWRDGFLQNVQDPSSNLANPEPQYVAEYEQYDFSASYRINENYVVLFEGINITDETTHKHGRYNNHFLEFIETGPRYRIGLRGNF